MKLHLVRHGETDINAAGRLQGSTNSLLTERGHRQARELGVASLVWNPAAIYSSPLKRARDVAERLNAPLAIIEKRRLGNNDRSETLNVIGDVEGKAALTFDDEILTGGTVIHAADALIDAGVTEVYCCATHPVFSVEAPARLAKSKFQEVVVADTVPVPSNKRNGKITVLSVASLLGEAIYRIHKGNSVGELFNI